MAAMGDPSDRRGKVTAENKEEAKRLSALWAKTKAERDAAGVGTQEAFGAEYDIGNQAAVGFFLTGKTALSLKGAVGFARGFRCSVADFSPRLAAQIDELAQLATNRPHVVDAVARISMALATLPPEAREAVASNMQGWARSGGRQPWAGLVATLLDAKHQDAAR